jgi:hypothetical protein
MYRSEWVGPLEGCVRRARLIRQVQTQPDRIGPAARDALMSNDSHAPPRCHEEHGIAVATPSGRK